jgi:hypothetical protein
VRALFFGRGNESKKYLFNRIRKIIFWKEGVYFLMTFKKKVEYFYLKKVVIEKM